MGDVLPAAAAQLHRTTPHPLRATRVRAALSEDVRSNAGGGLRQPGDRPEGVWPTLGGRQAAAGPPRYRRWHRRDRRSAWSVISPHQSVAVPPGSLERCGLLWRVGPIQRTGEGLACRTEVV